MARLPSWRDQIAQSYSGAQKWGTGVNPIHGKRGGYEGRNLAPGIDVQPDTGFTSFDYGTPDDFASPGPDMSFMNAHPNLGEAGARGRTDMPPYGPESLGETKRTRAEGRNPREGHTEQQPRGKAGAGWENKRESYELESAEPDDTQVFIKTSRAQRNLNKNNGLAVTRGTDTPRAEIPSRHRGMRGKVWAGQERHDDMLPKSQDYYPRAWRYRGVGTGPLSYMEPNQFYGVTPMTREIPADVYTGVSETAGIVDDGYSDDFGWY